MAWMAYLLLPITGLVAYLKGATARVRFHGLQAIVYGFVWPASSILVAYLSGAGARVVFSLGGVVWLGLMVATSIGRDPKLPVVAGFLDRVAQESPGG